MTKKKLNNAHFRDEFGDRRVFQLKSRLFFEEQQQVRELHVALNPTVGAVSTKK